MKEEMELVLAKLHLEHENVLDIYSKKDEIIAVLSSFNGKQLNKRLKTKLEQVTGFNISIKTNYDEKPRFAIYPKERFVSINETVRGYINQDIIVLANPYNAKFVDDNNKIISEIFIEEFKNNLKKYLEETEKNLTAFSELEKIKQEKTRLLKEIEEYNKKIYNYSSLDNYADLSISLRY